MPVISLQDANDMIQQGINIRESFKDVLPQFCAKNNNPLGVNYNANDFNAFVFSKDEILRFFDDANIVDTQGKHIPGASHLIVVVGAQIKEGNTGTTDTSQSFKPGELTVIAAGVNKINNHKYICLNIKDPADEHTPRTAITELSNAVTGNINLNFNLL